MDRLAAITLDEAMLGASNANVEHERAIAIFDLLDDNNFCLSGHEGEGPFSLHITLHHGRLVFMLTSATGEPLPPAEVPMSLFRKVLKDYFAICSSYYDAIKTASPSEIELIDHDRRAWHDEGARILSERLKERVVMDHTTARRLFTLISALHWKG